MEDKSKVRQWIDKVVGDDGIKTDLDITLTDASAAKLAIVIIGSGLVVALGSHLMRAMFRNKQLATIQQSLSNIEKQLKSP